MKIVGAYLDEDTDDSGLELRLSHGPDPYFAEQSDVNNDFYLVEVSAFSLCYRDFALLKDAGSPVGPRGIGSDFVGTIISRGPTTRDKHAFAIGSTVVAVPVWPPHFELAGMPTNHASRQYIRCHEMQLATPTSAYPDSIKATIGCNLTTAAAIMNSVHIGTGTNVLVRDAHTHLGATVIALLHAAGVSCWATLPRAYSHYSHILEALGATVATDESNNDMTALARHIKKIAGFSNVIDILPDRHFESSIKALSTHGSLVTSRLFGNEQHKLPEHFFSVESFISQLVEKSLTIRGVCLGVKSDFLAVQEGHAQALSSLGTEPTVHKFADSPTALVKRQRDTQATANPLMRTVYQF